VNETRLRRLLELLHGSDVDEFEWQHSFWRGTRLRITRHRAAAAVAVPTPQEAPGSGLPGAPAVVPAPPAATPAPVSDDLVIVSPMVGTFYRASSPEAQPFVSPGDRVRIGQTVGVIEAMKILNEIHAEVEGQVAEVLAANGDPVEYNQPLIRLRPL
jgi:acetyl-CoA carboxylase biotin carboxyl carrier protein